MDDADLCYTPAVELAAAVRARQLSPVELVDTMLARIDRLNPALNAYCTVDPEGARAAARTAEAALANGRADLGRLHGVPCSVKDITYTAGLRTTLGSRLYADYVPAFDAPLVQRLKAAGAVVLGKTTTPEFGWKGATDSPLFGVSRNPWDLTRTPGGSSGGGAAAVAAGLGPLATGSDGAGSIRIPAAFCGIAGLKPSFGLVPYYPASAAELIAHAGPMARTVRDVALMLDIMAGRDERDRGSLPFAGPSFLAACDEGLPGGLRLAWSADLGFAPVEPEVRALAERAALRFADLGGALEAADPGFDDPLDTIQTLFYCGVAARLSALPGWRELADPGLVRVVDAYAGRSAYDFARAMFARNALWDDVRPFFQRCDLLLTPTVPLPAFPVGLDAPEAVAGVSRPGLAWTPFTYPFNLTGQPAMTVPCGWTAAGLPVGLQIVGRPLEDALVLRAAAAFEAAQPWAGRRPPEA